MVVSDGASPDRVFVGFGSNMGESAQILTEAWQRLALAPHVGCIRFSSPYRSAPVDMDSEQWFVNAVGEVRTSLSPHQFLSILMGIEKAMGRKRDFAKVGYQDRVIDLDLLYFGRQIVQTADLVLPHPQRLSRLFVLTPLAEIASSFLDDSNGKTILELEKLLLRKIKTGIIASQSICRANW